VYCERGFGVAPCQAEKVSLLSKRGGAGGKEKFIIAELVRGGGRGDLEVGVFRRTAGINWRDE